MLIHKLDIFSWGDHWQKVWDSPGCRICEFLGGDRIYLLLVGQQAGNFCSRLNGFLLFGELGCGVTI